MEIFNIEEFKKLAAQHHPRCVSIYIPTHRRNEEGDANKKDQITLKNQLSDAEKQLITFGMSESEVEEYLKPITDLLEKIDFWTYNEEGLALFLAEGELKIYRLSVSFEPYTYVGTHFYLKPLTALLVDQNRHYLLNLSLGEVKLYEVTENHISAVDTGDSLPGDLTDVVGKDFEEKHLQQRTGQGEGGESGGMYHGHGVSNQTIKKEEALEYFRKIDDIVNDYIHDEKSPLIVACVDYLFPIYKEANTYNHLVDSHISGNRENEEKIELAKKSRELLKQAKGSKLKTSKAQFEEALSNGRASYEYEDTIPAAIAGRVETLILDRREHLWGTYEEKTHSVETTPVRKVGESDLLDLAATHTVLNGGDVYLLDNDEMPAPEKSSNAIFRYSRAE